MSMNNDAGEKIYKCTFGTSYFLVDRKPGTELAPITYNISHNGNTFSFIPSETIKNDKIGYATATITDDKLLRGITKIMALASGYCSAYTALCDNNVNEYKDIYDKRFYIPSNTDGHVDLYVNFTHNMIFPDTEDYKNLVKYAVGSYRYPHLYGRTYGRSEKYYFPKDLICIKYSDFLYTPKNAMNKEKYNTFLKDTYNRYLKTLKEDEDVISELTELKINEQIDIPTKLVLYGICKSFGKESKIYGLCGILYVEHKSTIDDYLKFKELCNEHLNEYLEYKSLNIDYKYILNLTPEKLRKDYPDFKSLEPLMLACGYLHDPRRVKQHYDTYTYYDRIRDNDYYEYGLERWLAIKKYYPELYNKLKMILDYYLEIKDEFHHNFRLEYYRKFDELADNEYNNVINSESDDIEIKPQLIVKYVKQFINKNNFSFNVENYKDLRYSLHMIFQAIIDKINEICTNKFKEYIREYRRQHPRAKQMTITFEHNLTTNLTEILKCQLFDISSFPAQLRQIFELPQLRNVYQTLIWAYVASSPRYKAYINGKEVRSRHNAKQQVVFEIPDIDEAAEEFEIYYYTTLTYAINDNDVPEKPTITTPPESIVSVNEIAEIMNILLSAGPLSLDIIWIKDNYSRDGFEFKEPTELSDSFREEHTSLIGASQNIDELLANKKVNAENMSNLLKYTLVLKYDDQSLINVIDKIKNISGIQKALAYKK